MVSGAHSPRADDSVGLMLRIPRELRDRLRNEAQARLVSVNMLCWALLSEGLERLLPPGPFTRDD